MLLHQHARGQHFGRVAGQDRHQALLQNGPSIQIGRDHVHRGTRKFAARINGALVGVEPGKGRQQRGVNIDEPPAVVGDKTGREDAHKARQHHQRRLKLIDLLHQRRVKSFAAGKGLVVQHCGGNALFLGKHQAARIGLVADHGCDLRPQALVPALLLGSAHNGCHIGAAAGNQDHDVFHGGGIIAARQRPESRAGSKWRIIKSFTDSR